MAMSEEGGWLCLEEGGWSCLEEGGSSNHEKGVEVMVGGQKKK